MTAMIPRERMSSGQWVAPWLRHQHEARYAWAAPRGKGRRVLDVACGNGYGTAVLAHAGATPALGADIALEALADAEDGGQTMLINASVLSLPFEKETFDLIVSLETIEHVRDDQAYVAELRRVLRSDGALICSTPNRRLLNPGTSIEQRPFNPFHVREYNAEELERVLSAQFADIVLLGQTRFGRRYVRLLEQIGRRVPMAAVRMHQMRKLLGMPFERRAKHEPAPLPFPHGEPEVLVAVCQPAAK